MKPRVLLCILLCVVILSAGAYALTYHSVTVTVNRQSFRLWTQADTVAELLMSLNLRPDDLRLSEQLNAPLSQVPTVELKLARPVTVSINERVQTYHRQVETVEQLLTDLNLSLSPADRLWLDQRSTILTATLPFSASTLPPTHFFDLIPPNLEQLRPYSVTVRIERPALVTLYEDALRVRFHTTATTVSRAL